MSNEQKQPQEGTLTAKEFFNQYMVARQNYPLEAWASELAERYADYQTAALRDDFRQMMERRDHWKKEAELLREELEVIKARNEGLEQEKQEYIDKYNLAISELEAVKKERDKWKQEGLDWKKDCEEVINDRDKIYKEWKERFDDVASQLSEVTRQRDEANELLREFRSRATHGNIQDLVDFDEKVQLHLSRLSSGDTKPESPWISVEERLPRQGVKVLIAEWNSDMNGERIYNYTVGSYNGNKESIAEFTGVEEEAPGTYWPSHWMPLPAPPESLTDKK